MANTDRKNGLAPVKHYFGGLVRANNYTIADQLAANIYSGDPVKSTGTGKNITVAAAGNTMLGVFAGCQYLNSLGEVVFSPFWATGTITKAAAGASAQVFDDPGIAYEVQVSGATGLVAADIGAVADLTFATAGSATTGRSGVELDQTTISASGSAGVKILDFVQRPDNALGPQCKALVLINEHELKAAMTAV